METKDQINLNEIDKILNEQGKTPKSVIPVLQSSRI